MPSLDPRGVPTPLHTVAHSLASIEIWPVAGAVALSMFSVRLVPFALVLMAAFWGLRYLGYGYASLRTPADWPLVVLVVMLLVSLWHTPMPTITRPAVSYALLGPYFYYTVVNWGTSQRRLWLLTTGLLATGLLLAASTPISVDWSSGTKFLYTLSFTDSFRPLVPDPMHANVMSGALVLIFPLGLAWLVFGWRLLAWYERLLAGAAALVILLALLVMQSRGALLAVGGALVVLILLRWRRSRLLFLAVVVFALLCLGYLGATAVSELSVPDGPLTGLKGRGWAWSWALSMMRDFPLTGIGMGTYEPTVKALFRKHFQLGTYPHAHNVFLQVAVDLGIPGLLAWLAIMLCAVRAAWRVLRLGALANNGWFAGLGAGLLCSQAALVVHGMVDAVTWGLETAVLPWGIWGMAVASRNVIAQEAGEKARSGQGSQA